MIKRFQNCIGLRLFRIGRWQAELWVCPQWEVISAHRHPNETVWIFGLWGKMKWWVNGKGRAILGPIRKRQSTGSWVPAMHKVGPDDYHAAAIQGRRGIFLSLERWICEPTSASEDIVFQ